MMEISVAMATYNGGKHLAEQLSSIAAQGLRPDELVICDDGSRDQTVEIARRFAASAPFAVRVEVNPRNLGVSGNFARTVGLCRGRWIVLADQDDVWMSHKLETLTAAVAARPDAGFVFSDAVLVDERRKPLGRRLWQAVRFSRGGQRAIEAGQAARLLLKRNIVTGATMMFRAADRDMLLPVGTGWVHDGWFALLLSAVADVVAVPEPLIEYRQHAGQQIGAKRFSLWDLYRRAKEQGTGRFAAIAESYAAARDRLRLFRDRLRDPRILDELEAKVRHYRLRSRMHAASLWRLPLVARELALFHYAKYSSGWRSLVQDLLIY